MPQYAVQSPDGRTVTLEGDSPPSESDLDEIFSSLPEEQPAGSMMTPERLAQIAAASGGGGFTTNPRLTSGQQIQGIAGNAGIAASMIAPELLTAAIPALAPAAAAGSAGWLGRLGVLGAASTGAGAAVQGAPDVLSGQTTPGQYLKSVAANAGLGLLAAPVLGAVGQKAFQTGLGAITGGRAGAAEAFVRPLWQSPANAEANAAAQAIESTTGIKPAQSVGEALGNRLGGGTYAELEHQLGNLASGAIPIDERNRIARSVLHTASGLFGTGADSSEIAEKTITALNTELNQNITGPAKDAVESMSKSVSERLKDQLANTVSEGAALTTPATEASPYYAGNIGKLGESEAQTAFADAEKQLYDNYRVLLGKSPPKVSLKNTGNVVDSIIGGGLKTTDAAGNEVPIASTIQDADARKFLGQIQQAVSTPQDIENLRLYRSQIGQSIGRPSELSGLPDAAKKALYKGISQDIDAAIAKIPDKRVRDALTKANTFRKENIDKFNLPASERAGIAVEEGGTTGQSLFNTVLSDTDKYNTFKSVLGDRFDAFKEAARDAILTKAQAVKSGETFSVGSALDKISLPKEIETDLFPQMNRLRDLAAREVKLTGLLKGVPDDAIKSLGWMQSNMDELKQFLTPGNEQQFLDTVRIKAAETQRLNNSILRDVALGRSDEIAKNPNGFLNNLLSGTVYTREADLKGAMDVVARHSPKTFHDLQVEYLNRMLNDSTINGYISGEELASKISKPLSGKSPTSGGQHLSTANAILGPAKTDAIRSIAESLGKTQKNLLGREIPYKASLMELIASSGAPVDIATMVASGPLNNRSRGLITDLFTKLPTEARYHVASQLLTDPRFLPLLNKPIENLTGAEASTLATAIARPVVNNQPR